MFNEKTNYLEILGPLLRSFRAEILENFGKITNNFKSDGTVFTELDRSIEKRIREALEKEYPDIGFDGEEYGKSGPEDKYWLIDPTDGTQNFIRGINQIGTILGLVENGEVVIAAIFDPIEDELFYAVKGQGAWCNNKKIEVTEREIGNSFIELTAPETVRNSAVIDILEKNSAVPLRTHGSASKQTSLSAGKIDGIINFCAGGSAWDYAPGILLCEEAGAVLTIFDSKSRLETKNFSMLTKIVNDQIIEELNNIWPN